jgi:ribosomal protein S18 acetylase RimI-like enzyme
LIELVTLHSDDWPTWRELRLRALEEAPDAFQATLAGWERATEHRWRERLELPDSLNLVARIDGQSVGMATGAPFDGVFEIISMWVAPEARGRGVGDALVAGICRWARERGAAELHLDVVENNATAINLYARHGFVDAGPSREPGERVMVKSL